MQNLSFRVADVVFELSFNDIDDPRSLLPSYAPFFVKRVNENDVIMHMTIGQDLVQYSNESQYIGEFDCGDSIYVISRFLDGDYKILISDMEKRPSCALRASTDFSKCTATLTGNESMQRFGLGNAIMVAYAFAASQYGVLLMHASVTMYQGMGYLFLGKSGTGKSTHSSLWKKYVKGADLLNDDNPAVRCLENGQVRVYGTPWSGKTPCYRNLSVSIGAFVRLQQSPNNDIQRESNVKAYASILSSCSTMIWDEKSYDAILANVNGVIKSTPVYFLRCRADEEAARICCKAVISGTANNAC